MEIPHASDYIYLQEALTWCLCNGIQSRCNNFKVRRILIFHALHPKIVGFFSIELFMQVFFFLNLDRLLISVCADSSILN